MIERGGQLIEVDLADGPFEGGWALAFEGELFIYIYDPKVCKNLIYGLGDDGKYYYCPEIPVDVRHTEE